jgi:hypothetical protein
MIWKNIKDKKPIAYKTGGWDGRKSDALLVCTRSGKYHVAEMYQGILDGNEFCDFYDIDDYEIKGVIFWIEIDSPL